MVTATLSTANQHKNAGTKKDKADINPDWVSFKGTNFDKITMVKKGISKNYLVSFKITINIDYDRFATILGTTKTTLHKKQGDELFSSSISEKTVALMDIYRYGYEVFEDRDKFNKWIQTSNRALGDRIPLDVMDTIFGLDEVKNIITRIEHGVYS